jgi:hypothetical protein
MTLSASGTAGVSAGVSAVKLSRSQTEQSVTAKGSFKAIMAQILAIFTFSGLIPTQGT